MADGTNATQLKVGELARRTGLTVRTLHHYDEIGLLKPSGRSESGYRLYGPDDVARLHGIQALRHMGLPLAEIAALFEGRGAPPERIIEQQLRALDLEITRATELRERLVLMRGKLTEGGEPALQDWLSVLAEMATYGKYFSAGELRAIFDGWDRVKDEWPALIEELRAVMDRGIAWDAPEVQPFARRWMSLVLGWMGSDFDLIERWDQMYRCEPYAHISRGAPPEDMIAYIRQATDLRMTLLRRHFTAQELGRFRHVPECEWRSLESAVNALLAQDAPPGGAAARAVLRQWLALMDALTGHDAALRDKLFRLSPTEDPPLAAGSPLTPPVRTYLRVCLRQALDPHVA